MDFKAGDKVIFVLDWDPHFAADDPFYVEPVPKGTMAKVLDVGKDHIRIKFEDTLTWPNAVTVWAANTFNDGVPEGLPCIRKV